jgi:hypothetical protein
MGGRPPRDGVADQAEHVIAFVVVACAPGTNGNPPRGQIQIEEALHGTLPLERRDATFPPPSDEAFYAIRGGGDEGLARYNATARHGPAAGTRLIAVVYPRADGSLGVDSHASWPDTEQQRSRFRTSR